MWLLAKDSRLHFAPNGATVFEVAGCYKRLAPLERKRTSKLHVEVESTSTN